MALKRFSEFNKLDQKDNVKLPTNIDKLGVTKPSEKGVEEKKTKTKKEKESKKDDSLKGPDDQKTMKTSKNLDHGKVIENCLFVGKTVKFPDDFKPSSSYKLLESKKVSKEKLHYIISKQPNNSLAIIKYNEKADKNLFNFINQVLEYYKRDNTLKPLMEKIKLEGDDKWAILKNIPNEKISEQINLIDILVNDLTKLLK